MSFYRENYSVSAEARPLGMSAGCIPPLWESCLTVHPFLNLQNEDNDIYFHCYC